jgi:hypothetical protein
MTGDDAELVALIDNELDEKAQEPLLARLAEDEGLRKRYEALRDAGDSIATSLDALIENAPLPRLRAMLPFSGGRARGPLAFLRRSSSRSRGRICAWPTAGECGGVGRA